MANTWDARGARLALQQLHAARGPVQSAARALPAPDQHVPLSQSARLTHEGPSEVTEAFPVLEETVAAPAAEPSPPVAARGRRRSSSFRADQAEQAAVLRTAQNTSVEVSKPAVESPTKTRHRRTSSIRENPFAPATGIFENTHGPKPSETVNTGAAKIYYEKEDTYTPTPSKTIDTEAEEVYYEEPHASYTHYPQRIKMPKDKKVPKPGPAKLGPNSTPKEWLQCALRNQYLPERIMKQLCESVKEKLMEESNIQPVSTPVTICGDLHGQFYDVIELFRIAGGIPSDDVVTEASPAPKGVISSEDIEPPSVITDPKLKRKMKNVSLEDRLGSGSGVSDEDDAEEEQRGRSRGPVNTASLGPLKEGNTGLPGNQNFIFLGDFVDRGYFSLETLTLLLCLKNLWPDRITLIRGNHESRQITQVYGFYEECLQKYGNASVWKACTQVFDFLILGAVVDGKVLCVHGGLSPEIRTLDQIRVIARAQEIPHEGAFCDLVWSDPEDIGTWAISPRGAGWLFGDKVAREFNHVNDFELIARAHQLVNEGYKWHFEDKSVVTVWSAPNYCYRCGNVASIMNVGEDLKPSFNIFSAVPDNQRAVPAATGRRNDYFL